MYLRKWTRMRWSDRLSRLYELGIKTNSEEYPVVNYTYFIIYLFRFNDSLPVYIFQVPFPRSMLLIMKTENW